MAEETTEAPATTKRWRRAPPTPPVRWPMKGTTPLVPLDDTFTSRLWPRPRPARPDSDYNYAAETYDAMIVIAAAEVAQTDGLAMADQIPGVTRDGEKCTTFADCKALIAAGTDIDYDGLRSALTMAGNGDPIAGSYGVLTFGDDNRLMEDVQYITVEALPEADVPPIPATYPVEGDGVLKFGSILPQTGFARLPRPPELAAAELAIMDIVNEAGGVLGQPATEYRPATRVTLERTSPARPWTASSPRTSTPSSAPPVLGVADRPTRSPLRASSSSPRPTPPTSSRTTPTTVCSSVTPGRMPGRCRHIASPSTTATSAYILASGRRLRYGPRRRGGGDAGRRRCRRARQGHLRPRRRRASTPKSPISSPLTPTPSCWITFDEGSASCGPWSRTGSARRSRWSTAG
ncbi:MAG: hypothetical protein R2705_03870 [Ilumatobacteraceae bacterium]